MRLELLYHGDEKELPSGEWRKNAEFDIEDGYEWINIYCRNVRKIDTWGNAGASFGEPCTTADIYFADGSEVTLEKLSNVTCLA